MASEQSEPRPAFGPLAVKSLLAALPLLAFFWGMITYIDTRQASLRRDIEAGQRELTLKVTDALREAKRPFYQKQLDLYFETARQVAILVTRPDSPERRQARARFWQLYWGELCIVEEPGVEMRMVAFGKALTAYEQSAPAARAAATQAMERAAYELAHTLREEIRDTWQTDLPDPGGAKRESLEP